MYNESEKFQLAFDNLFAENLQRGIDQATRAAYEGNSYRVQLFDDGTYCMPCYYHVSAPQVADSLILEIPALDPEDDNEDPEARFYRGAVTEMQDRFAQACVHYDAWFTLN